MNKQLAMTVKPGDVLIITDNSNTPGRKFDFPAHVTPSEIKSIKVDSFGCPHFDIGFKLPEGEPPLTSRESTEEIDGSDTYWMHYSRFQDQQNNLPF